MRPARVPLSILTSLVADRGSELERWKRHIELMQRRIVQLEARAEAMGLEIDDLKRRVAALEQP